MQNETDDIEKLEFESSIVKQLYQSIYKAFSEKQKEIWNNMYQSSPELVTRDSINELLDFYNHKCPSEQNMVMVPIYSFKNWL